MNISFLRIGREIWKKFLEIRNFILDLLFPIECLGCGKEKTYLCPDCLGSIYLEEKLVCPHCFKPSFQGLVCQKCKYKSYLDGLFFACSYQNKLIEKAIKAFKYRPFVKSLVEPLSLLLIKKLQSSLYHLSLLKDSLIIPIPLHKRKLIQRGFNQAELIAQELRKVFSLNIGNDILKRKRNTKAQADLKGEKRKENIKDAFKISNKEKINGKRIILIDDVATTGATLEEAAKILKLAGAKEVFGFVIAKG